MLYELYTGEAPGAVQDLRNLPPGIAAIVERCTATDPQRRFQTIRELRSAFDLLCRRRARPNSAEQLLQVLGEILAKGSADTNDVRKLVELVISCQEDEDVLHESAVKLPT